MLRWIVVGFLIGAVLAGCVVSVGPRMVEPTLRLEKQQVCAYWRWGRFALCASVVWPMADNEEVVT